MRKGILFSVLLVVLALLAATVLQLRASLVFEQGWQALRWISQPSRERAGGGKVLMKSEQAEMAEAQTLAQKSSNVWFALPRSFAVLADLKRQQAERESDPGRRVLYFCEALSLVGQALRADPANAKLLTNWANLRQILGAADCALPDTRGDYRQALREALASAPADVLVKYAAALVFLWGGEREQALLLFHQALRFGTILDRQQEEFIFSQVQDVHALRSVIPPRFPQIAKYSLWLALNEQAAPPAEASFTKVLSELQLRAVELSAEEFQDGAIPLDIHWNRMVAMQQASLPEAVRRRIDQELAVVLRRRGQVSAAAYFADRSRAQRLPCVLAYLSADTRPQKSPLVEWGRDQLIYFDDFYASIGFFLPPGQKPRIIELQARSPLEEVPASMIKVYASTDNQNWQDVTGEVQQSSFNALDRATVVLRLNSEYRKYWKIHFASALHQRSFINELSEVIRVYGAWQDSEADRGGE